MTDNLTIFSLLRFAAIIVIVRFVTVNTLSGRTRGYGVVSSTSVCTAVQSLKHVAACQQQLHRLSSALMLHIRSDCRRVDLCVRVQRVHKSF